MILKPEALRLGEGPLCGIGTCRPTWSPCFRFQGRGWPTGTATAGLVQSLSGVCVCVCASLVHNHFQCMCIYMHCSLLREEIGYQPILNWKLHC